MVTLRTMTEDEFGRFRSYSIDDYADDLAGGTGLSHDKALAAAAQAFDGLLKDGKDTEGQYLMSIDDENSGNSVGWIWYFFEEEGGVRRVWLNDFLIFGSERRKGFASAALSEMEKRAAESGCAESALWVWDRNAAGQRMYRACGYAVAECGEGGKILKKALR